MNKLIRHKNETEEINIEDFLNKGQEQYKFLTPENRFVKLAEPINNTVALNFIDELYYAASIEDSPVIVMISSPGGDIYGTMMIIDAIQSLNIPTIGLSMGCAASGAFYAFQACTHRVMMKNSILFWHEMIYSGEMEIKTLAESEKLHKDYRKLNDHVLSSFKKRMKYTKEEWNTIFANKNDIYFNANEALKVRLSDKTITKLSQLKPYFLQKENKK